MPDKIMLVDDEPNILSALSRVLRLGLQDGDGQSYAVETFDDPCEALRRSQQTPQFALVVADYRMPQMNGVEFLQFFREWQPDCARIILSGYTDLNGLVAAINDAGIMRFISKPWNDHELLCTLRQVLQIRNLDLENKRLADLVRKQSGVISAHEAELRRLERIEPGITHVNWGPDGSILLEDPGEVRF